MKKLFTLLSAVLFCLGANAQAQKLADVIKATMDTCKHEIVPVFLTKYQTYVLDSKIDLGTRGVILWGGQATISVEGEGQISTSGFLEVRNANFDMTAATPKVAPIALSANPAAELKGACLPSEVANADCYYNNHMVAIVKCNFKNLAASLFYANKAAWALNTLKIDNNIVQMNHATEEPVISLVGSGRGAIKNIVVTNNVFYNIDKTNTAARFIRYGNASNAQPKKVWGEGSVSVFTMKNNTLALNGKEFANNFPNVANYVVLDWKQNIFFNTPLLQKIGRNNTRTFTAEDNVLFNDNGKTLDATDLQLFGSEDTEVGLSLPAEALDFNNINALVANFKPAFTSKASQLGCGAPRFGYTFGSVLKTPGYGFQLILAPDLLAQYALVSDPATKKPGINTDLYPWIKYVRADGVNVLENGQNEAQQSNRWTDLDPATDVKGEWLQVKGANGSVNSPVVGKNIGKSLFLYVKGAQKVVVYATGSASGSAADGNAIIMTARSTSGTVCTGASTPGGIYGKGTASDKLELVLAGDENDGWEIEINSENKDMMITGIRVYGADETVFPACYAPTTKAPGTNYEVVLGPDMLTMKAKDGQDKPAINDAVYSWIVYTNPTSTVDDGTAEVQQSNRWTDINPTTGVKGEWIQVKGANGSVNSPVISGEWKKYMVANIMNTTKFRVYATGSASTTEASGEQLVLTATCNDGSVLTTATTPGTIWGKGKASDYAELALDPDKAYSVKIEAAVKDVQILGFNLTGTDTTVAPAEENPGMGDVTGVEEIETENVNANAPVYNVLGQRANANTKGILIKGNKKFINR